MKQRIQTLRRQAGMTLMEIIASLAIIAVVIAGALALYGSASSSQASTQMLSDLTATRSSVRQLFQGQGSYGTASLNSTLIASKRVPSTMSVSGSTITHSLNGTMTVTGATATFTIALTNMPTDVCTLLLTNAATGWTQVQVGTATAITTFPIAPATASSATNCGATNANTVTFTAS